MPAGGWRRPVCTPAAAAWSCATLRTWRIGGPGPCAAIGSSAISMKEMLARRRPGCSRRPDGRARLAHRILVVDDDPHIRDVISFALEKAGMTTQTARDGGEALALFQRHPADMIILDVGMPDTDGLAVCREIRKSSDVPILFLSARDDEIDRIIGLEIGGDDYVTKPFSPREMIARVNIILKRSAAASAAQQDQDSPLSCGALTLHPMQHT